MYCQNCGAKLLPDSRFCIECGTRSGSAGRRGLPRLRVDRYAPLIVVAVVLVVAAGAIVSGSWSAKPPPNIPPRSPSGGAMAGPMAEGGAPQELPANHPPLALPDDVKEKIRQLTEEAKAQPDNIEAWKKVAMVQYRAGTIEPKYLADAAESYEHVLAREPQNLEALRAMGNISYDRDDPANALAYYEKYLAVKPGDPEVMTDMGTMYLSGKDAPKAIETYTRVLEANPKFFQAQFNLAIAYRSTGDDAAAVAAMEKARELAPDDPSRQQIDRLIARVKGEPAPEAPPAGAVPNVPASAAPAAVATGGSFKEDVEAIFRQHPIVGPKLDRVEWPEAHTARVVLRDFPMEAMPPFVKQKFFDRIAGGVKDARGRHAETAAVQIQLVDAASGKVMETLTP